MYHSNLGLRVMNKQERSSHHTTWLCIALTKQHMPFSAKPTVSTMFVMACYAHHTTSICISYLRLTDSCITQLEAQEPSKTCDEIEEGEDEHLAVSECNSVAARAECPATRVLGVR